MSLYTKMLTDFNKIPENGVKAGCGIGPGRCWAKAKKRSECAMNGRKIFQGRNSSHGRNAFRRRNAFHGKKTRCAGTALCCMAAMIPLGGCASPQASGKTEIEIVQYKPEAANYFKTVEEQFNATHDDIHLTINSPNDATTILKTRFIREDYPDIIGIGGDINYSYFVDAEILTDVSGYRGLRDINQGYLDIAETLELVPVDGTYIVPYVANAAGVLYNRQMFADHGWQIPETWEELLSL